MMGDNEGPIGQLEGRWALLFKVAIAFVVFVMPFLIAMQAWEIQQIHLLSTQQAVNEQRWDYFMDRGPRYTPEMAMAELLKLKQEIHDEVSQRYPPAWLIKDLDSITRRVEALEQQADNQ
jgi:hypothetical protein